MNRGLSFSRARHQKGFTIIELLTVIVVLSILVTITALVYNGVQQDAHDTAVKSDLQKIAANFESYYAKYDRYPNFSDQLSDPTMNFSEAITKNSTSTTGLDPGMNMLYCRHTSTNRLGTPNRAALPVRQYVIITQSVSGKVFRYSSETNTITEGNVWVRGDARQTCNNVGIPQVNISDRDLFYFNHRWESFTL